MSPTCPSQAWLGPLILEIREELIIMTDVYNQLLKAELCILVETSPRVKLKILINFVAYLFLLCVV